ncbi:mitochondrial translation initiation factor 2 isoform X2 [Xylocopa sonorina]|uniref:mitochondrial translation initiation factor 2 isoform X2 n=1 Tax=Xylocopa sonorina TaxID=1818115 RepID=UPI00403AD8FE
MAASMVRAYIQCSLPRQLADIIWREQNINCSSQILSVYHFRYRCYHVTAPFWKKRKAQEEKKSKLLFNEETLFDIALKKSVKKSLPLIKVWKEMTVQELADSAMRDVSDVLELLHLQNRQMIFKENSILIDIMLISRVARGLGGKAKVVPKEIEEKKAKYKDITKRPPPDKSVLVRRHPIVTIMGHVDHGKTTLLDSLRNTSVVKSEFGGITQHIGAFDVTLKSGERVTFLDTPGHAAFKAMRHRGALVTDIVVLVVAADDGVMDQTLQSIEMAKDANVPIIVAINKIDKPNVNIERVQKELAEYDVVVEELGGNVQCVQISALKGTNLEELTEAIILQAELMNLKGDPTGLVEAVAIECSNHVGRGKLVTALIQRGTLKKGCLLVSGHAYGKVRALFNDSGHLVTEAKPSEAVQTIGWKILPNVGDEILEVQNDKVLQEVLKFRGKQHNEALAIEHKTIADEKRQEHLIEYKKILGIRWLFGKDKRSIKKAKEKLAEQKKEHATENIVPAVNIIIKGDVAGSVEALLDIIDTYTYDNICRLNVVHYGIGFVTESDIELAETFNAIIYGFNIRRNKTIEGKAKKKGVTLRFHNIVYKLIEDIKEKIDKVLPEIDVEKILGEGKVLQVFDIKDKKQIVNVAGCLCTKGVLLKSGMYRISRNGEDIYTGKLVSMRHLKEEKSTIEASLECGLRFEDPIISFQPGDIIICFKISRVQQKIDWNPGF